MVPGAPVCHRKIPTVHGLKVSKEASNVTTAELEYSHPENLEAWPAPNADNASLQFRLRRIADGHYALLFYDVI